MNEIYIILCTRTYINKPDDPYEYYAAFDNKTKADKACEIYKRNDERSGDYYTKYIVQNDNIQDKLPEEDV